MLHHSSIHAVVAIVLGAVLSFTKPNPAAAAAAAAGTKYNVLYFVADDLRPEFLAAYDQKVMITPTLDKLASEGLVFNHAYCSVAVCSPSRNSFMSGRRPFHTLIFDNSGGLGKDFRSNGQGTNWTTMPQHFKESGWITLGGGKTFHPNAPKHWDEPTSWSQDMEYFDFSYSLGPCPNAVKPKLPPGADHGVCSGIDTWCPMTGDLDQFYDQGLANNTIERLQYVAKKDKPFFIQSGFARPHAPWRVPQHFWDLYDNVSIPLATYKDVIDGMAGPAWHQQGFYAYQNGTVYLPEINKPLPDEVQHEMRRAYYASVSFIDYQMGRILDELDSLGLTKSTIVLLHGDHGWQLGEHNDWHKQTNFELATRVPLIMKHPNKPAAAGMKTQLFAELVDVFPTLADLAGTPTPTDVLDGVSLAPAFNDPTITTLPGATDTLDKNVTYTQYPGQNFANCSVGYVRNGSCTRNSDEKVDYLGYSMRTHSFRYTVWLPVTFNSDNYDMPAVQTNWEATTTSSPPRLVELYDHRGDDGTDYNWPGNDVNIAFDSANQGIIQELHQQVQHFFKDVQPPNNPKPSVY